MIGQTNIRVSAGISGSDLNGNDNRWFVRGFVQNIFDSDSVTGLYVTDASSGNFTNIFTLDPRRYGIAIGAKF